MPLYNIGTESEPDPELGARQRGGFMFMMEGPLALAEGLCAQESCCAFKLTHAVIRRRAAGLGGQTKIDVLLNGVSLWTDPDDRPVVLASGGDYQRIEVVPDVLNIPTDTRMDLSVVEVETGAPAGLTVQLFGYRL